MSVVGEMQLLEEHESGPEPDDQKCACGRFWIGMNDRCGHCFWEQTGGAQCPVCQSPEIPQVFYDGDMKGELRRVIAARKKWSAKQTQNA